MFKLNKISLIAITSALLLTLAISFAVFMPKPASTEVEAAYELPISGNQYVTELDYSSYDIESVSDVYDTKLQSQIKAQLEKLKKESNTTVDNPLIVSNPYLTNNNGVYINFKTDKEIKSVSYTVKTSGASDFTEKLVNSGTSTDFESQLIGLIAGKNNKVTLTITYADGSTEKTSFEYTPKKSNSGLQTKLDVTTYDSKTELDNGLYALIGDSTLENRVIAIVDNDGYVRNEIPLANYNSMRLTFDKDENITYAISNYSLVTVSKLGQVVAKYNVKSAGFILHHDYDVDSEGNIIALATSIKAKEEDKYVEDRIIKINTKTGKITEVANFETLLPDLFKKATGLEKHSGEVDLHDFVHINTIQVVNDDEYIVSSREQSSIMKLTGMSTGNPKVDTIISDPSIWEGIDTNGAKVLEKDGDFTSQLGQHSVTYVPGADDEHYTLYMFNNNSALFDSRTDLDLTKFTDAGAGGTMTEKDKLADNSYYYEYEVDETTGTYKLVKSFEVPYSPYISSVQNLSNGNILVDSGQDSSFTEYDSDGNPIATFKKSSDATFMYRVYKYSFIGYYFAE